MNTRTASLLVMSVTLSGFAYVSTGQELSAAMPSPRSDSVAVAATVDRFHKALASGDSATALALLAPDATILESGGIESRSEYRSHHLAGDIDFAKNVKSVREPLRVTLSGTTAWTTATSTTQGEFKGRSINSVGAESMILTRSGTKWVIRSIHWSSRTRRAAS